MSSRREATESLRRRAAVHAALGDPIRLELVDLLQLGDLSPQWAARRLGISPSLLSHHLRTLREAGVIEATRSRGDGRRQYLTLAADVVDDLAVHPNVAARRVLFVCSANSARSQLAEAMWRQASPIEVASAGSDPAVRVHPLALQVAGGRGLAVAEAAPRGYEDVADLPDLVVSVCDVANEADLPFTPRHRLHWSLPDPADVGTVEAFEDVADQLARRIARLASSTVALTT